MELIIVTGMSGAGKSQAIRALEDIGFYCVDNMPPKLMPRFAELCSQSSEPIKRVALVMDARSGNMFEDLRQNLQILRDGGQAYRILFLDCADEVLCRRYKETRRKHPLAGISSSTDEALRQERSLLAPLAQTADYRLDTTQLSPTQLKQQIVAMFSDGQTAGMVIRCMSFGFKYGFPAEADLMFDVRCFPNPFYVPKLKHKTGLDKAVRDYVLTPEETKGFLERLYPLVDYLIPQYENEGKTQLIIAIGCTGGKHRSVTIAAELAAHLGSRGSRVIVDHRDIEKN